MAVLFFIKVTSKIVNSFLFWPGLPKFIVNNLLGIPQRSLNDSRVTAEKSSAFPRTNCTGARAQRQLLLHLLHQRTLSP